MRSTSIKDFQCCLKGIQGLLKGNGQQHRPNKCRRVAISMSFYFLVFHPRLLLWSGDDCRSRSCYLVLINPYSFLEPSSCLMVNFIFCCGFINCFFLSELNICDTDFRLARFYLLLERFFFYFLELRDFDTRIGTYSSEGRGYFFVGWSPSCYCMANIINNRT